MNNADICLCIHTREEHFKGNCSRVNCQCKKFVLIDFGPALLAALKMAHQEMVGLRAYLETCDPTVIVDNISTLAHSLNQKCALVEDLIHKTETE